MTILQLCSSLIISVQPEEEEESSTDSSSESETEEHKSSPQEGAGEQQDDEKEIDLPLDFTDEDGDQLLEAAEEDSFSDPLMS